MNKTLKLTILACISIFSAILLYIEAVTYLFGGYNLLRYEYGNFFKLPYILGLAMLVIIPLILFVTVIKNSSKFILGIILYFVICLLLTVGISKLNINTREKYKQFSYQLWTDKPYVRQIMYESLVNNKDFKQLDKIGVVKMLGIPDENGENFIVYKTSPGKILIYFNNNKVDSVKYDSPQQNWKKCKYFFQGCRLCW